MVQGIEDYPVLREGPHQVPIPHSIEIVFLSQSELGLDAPGILEPDLVFLPTSIHIPEPGGLSLLIIADGGVMADRQLDCLLVRNGGRAPPLLIGEQPIVAVVGDT